MRKTPQFSGILHAPSVLIFCVLIACVFLFVSSGAVHAGEAGNSPKDEQSQKTSYNTENSMLQQESSSKTGTLDVKELTLRPDDERPKDQLGVLLFGRPLTIGGEYNIRASYRKDFRLADDAEDDILRIDQQFELELLYDLGSNIMLFLEAKPFYKTELYAEDDNPEKDEKGIKRGETWIYFGELFGSNLGLQVGRQNFEEKREWWWDEDLDAIRVYYKTGKLGLEFGVAEELFHTSTDESDIDPEEEDILRLIGSATWKWAKSQRVELFFLHQEDHSRTESPGIIVTDDEEDESDADLFWIGIRALGKCKTRNLGEFHYWLDTAFVSGEEILIDYDSIDGKSIVDEKEKRDVSGWAVDAGVTWRTNLPMQPSITLGYAVGSGDRDPDSGPDRSFRQTALQDNNSRFRGVDNFRYYGELLRPELSNLHILTLAIGLPLLKESSVEFLYHSYWQDHAAPFLRDTRIKAKPLGDDNSIGQEWNIVVGIEEWKHVELELVGAVFRAGNAFDSLSGETAGYLSFGFTYNF